MSQSITPKQNSSGSGTAPACIRDAPLFLMEVPCVQPNPWRLASQFLLHPPAVQMLNCHRPSHHRHGAAARPVKLPPIAAPPPPSAFPRGISRRRVSAGSGYRARRRDGRRERAPAPGSSARPRLEAGSCIVPPRTERWCTSVWSARTTRGGSFGSASMM